jgi:AcrR family transcriptional regulator
VNSVCSVVTRHPPVGVDANCILACIQRATRTLLPAADRKASILRAAAAAFARAGFRDTSMEDVAAEAGITRLIVYRHFGTKEDLYRAVLTEVSAQLIERFEAEVASGRPGVGLRTLLAVGRANPHGFALLWRHAAREPEFADYAHEWRRGAAVAAALAVPDSSLADVLRGWSAEALVDVLVALVLDWLDDGDPDRDEEWLEVVNRGVFALVAAWSPRS